jgi:hypothetical protein
LKITGEYETEQSRSLDILAVGSWKFVWEYLPASEIHKATALVHDNLRGSRYFISKLGTLEAEVFWSWTEAGDIQSIGESAGASETVTRDAR